MNTYLVNGHVVTANSKSEVVASKASYKKEIIQKLKEFGFSIKGTRNTIIAKSKLCFKESYYENKLCLWVSIYEQDEDKEFPFEFTISRYEIDGADILVSYDGASKSVDELLNIVKSKYKEYEAIAKLRNKVYELEQKFKNTNYF